VPDLLESSSLWKSKFNILANFIPSFVREFFTTAPVQQPSKKAALKEILEGGCALSLGWSGYVPSSQEFK
jgi:hypothetical protein